MVMQLLIGIGRCVNSVGEEERREEKREEEGHELG